MTYTPPKDENRFIVIDLTYPFLYAAASHGTRFKKHPFLLPNPAYRSRYSFSSHILNVSQIDVAILLIYIQATQIFICCSFRIVIN